MNDVHGILLVDKPKDWTSHDVCAFIKKRFRFSKVGHAGTLDPLATGLLVILLGRATKFSNSLSADEKEYEGFFELGYQTDSHDRQGKVIQTAPWEHITLDMVRAKASEFQGEIIQVPPMVSALKHKGMRLYDLARKGITVPRDGRQVFVREFKFHSMEGSSIHFQATVSKGTYVRTLVNDLGETLGCHATMTELKRLRSGKFSLKDAVTIDMLKEIELPALSSKIQAI